MSEKTAIRREAKRKVPGALRVSHILPRAYCIAKPAPHFAVFAVPPTDREPQVAGEGQVTVNNSTVAKIGMGDWASLAYVSTQTGGQMCVIFQ